jgi:hypothetical protein
MTAFFREAATLIVIVSFVAVIGVWSELIQFVG